MQILALTPLPTSPVKGEAPRGGRGKMAPKLDILNPVPIFTPSAALTGRYTMESTLNDCLARIAHLESAHACLRFTAPAFLFDAR